MGDLVDHGGQQINLFRRGADFFIAPVRSRLERDLRVRRVRDTVTSLFHYFQYT